MATYIQGVTDYIPDYQPFQPDLNFIGNYLQTKQSQYDTNFNNINNLYGKYLHAELTREPNIKRKDDYLKQIDFNLKRVARLDLSLQKNVEQATQIFAPFYKDSYLMKDMAYTKDFANKYNAVKATEKSLDKKISDTYWGVGVESMLHQKDEFKNSTDEESLQFGNVEYTPWVNAVDTYVENAKKLGISSDITKSDGRYFIRKKNGDMIIPSLQNIFAADFASSPAIQAVYKTEAYVNRKRHIKEHASEFGGNLVETEKSYLTKQYATIQEYVKLKHDGNKKELEEVTLKVEEGKKNVNEGKGNQFTPGYFRSLDEALGIATTNEAYTNKLNDDISNKTSKTAVTSSAPTDILNNIALLRARVDSGVASMFAERDINLAAYKYSRIGIVEDMSPDAYGVSAQNDAYARGRQKNQQEHQEKMLDKKILADVKKVMLEQGVKNGSFIGIEPEIDRETGKPTGGFVGIPNPSTGNVYTIKGKNASGGTTSIGQSILKENQQVETEFANKTVQSFEAMSFYVKSLLTANTITPNQANAIFSTTGKVTSQRDMLLGLINANGKKGAKNSGDSYIKNMTANFGSMTPEDFITSYKKNPAKFMDNKGAQYVRNVYKRIMQVADYDKGNPDGISAHYLNEGYHKEMTNYMHFAEGNEQIENKNREAVAKTLRSSTSMAGFTDSQKNIIAEGMLTENLSLVDFNTFKSVMTNSLGGEKVLNESGKYASFEMQAYYSLNESEKKEYNRINDASIAKNGSPKNSNGQRSSVTTEATPEGKNYLRSKFPLADYNAEDIYNDLKKNYKVQIQNGREITSLTPLITRNGKGNAVYNTDLSAINVSVNAVQSPGFTMFNEFQKDVSNINFYDQTNNPISFYGPNISGVKDTKELYSDSDDINTNVKIAELVIGNYYSKLGDDNTKNFKLASGQIALENRNTGVMVIYPTMDVIKELQAGEDGGIITQEIANAIAKNGISLMSNKKNWNNTLFTRNQRTGLETIVDALDEYDYEHPMGGGNIKIRKGTVNSLAPYSFEFKYNMMDEVTGEIKSEGGYYSPINININTAFEEMNLNFRQVAYENAQTWNRLYKNSTYAPGVSLNSQNPYE
jgi:D-ribose pyranose/furanose isomerase RbsD